MKVKSHPTTILRQKNKIFFIYDSKNENDILNNNNNIEDIYNLLYEDNFFYILTVSKTAFLSRIETKGKEIIETIYNQNQINNSSQMPQMHIIKKILLNLTKRYNEEYSILYQAYKNITNKIGHYNFLTNFRKHCERTEEYAYHSCINNNIQKLYEIKDNNNELKYALCPDCKYCFLHNCIRLVCKNCNKEYFSSIIPENQDKNILLATWEKYHCGSMKNQIMKCIKCKKDLYIDLNTNQLVCMSKTCNFFSKPLSILWKCSKCGRDFRSKPKIFNPTELEMIQKAVNLTLLIKKKAFPKELPCCHKNPEDMNFYHKEECRGVLYMGVLLDRDIIVCSECHAMNFEEKFTWICPKCNVKFHLHQLTSIKPFKARKYIINQEHTIVSKRNSRSNINIRNLKKDLNPENGIKHLINNINENNYKNAYKSLQQNIENHNKNNYEKIDYYYNNDHEKRIFSDYDRSCSKERNIRQYKRLESISIEGNKNEENSENNNKNNSQNVSIGQKRLDYSKKHKKAGRYKTLLDILEKRRKKESLVKTGRHLTNNSEFSFNDINSNNNYERRSTGPTNREGLGASYFRTSRNNNANNQDRSSSKWNIISETHNENILNEDGDFVYKKKFNISSYKKSNRYNDKHDDNNYQINNYKTQVVLLQDNQKKDQNISNININLNLNLNRADKNDEITSSILKKKNNNNNSLYTHSYIIDNDSLSKKSINNSTYKYKKDLQYFTLNNSSMNVIENRINRYNRRNIKKDKINNNINVNNSIVKSNKSEIQSTKSGNRKEEPNSHRITVTEYYNKKRNETNGADYFSKEKKNETIENTPKLGRCSNHSNNKNNNNDLIYQSGKNNFIRYNTRYNTSDRKEKDDNDIINNDKKNSFYKNKSNDKPIKVSRIYKNKIIQKKADNNGNNNFIYNISNKDGNTTTNTIIKYEKNDTVENIDNKSDYVRSKRCYMKMKKSNEKKLSMTNIIATPDKIKEISNKCIIPTFNDDDYKYIKPIGEGSYGMIFLVKNIKTNKEYALKKILCKNVNEILKYKRQLELIYSMKHDNIMKIYNLQFKYLDLTTYSLYVIMEKAIGDWSLDIRKRILNKKYYKEIEIINILKQVVSALFYLEERKVAHRDIKPQNILIFPGKIYKVADLGEAKNIDNINREITLRGSELYMSPLIYKQHKLNKKDLVHNAFKSDVFSLGFSTLYAICLNLNAIEDIREYDNMKSIANSIDKYFNKNLYSEKLYKLILNMIEIDENKRYSFREIDRELKHW
jgi:hypothetical protein